MKAFLSLTAILWTLPSVGYIFPFVLCLSLLFFSWLFVRTPQTITLPSCFLFLGDGFDHCLLYNVMNLCLWLKLSHMSFNHRQRLSHMKLSLSDLISWIYLICPLYKHKVFDLGHTWFDRVVFPTFFYSSLNFALKSSWSEPQSADCIELLHFWLQRRWSIWFQYWPSGNVIV